ncbi:MAG: hypothetical protein V4582_09875 [Pseudomonadota bacterium]
MQLEHLQIELRPRTHAQALDLGLALLREHGSGAYQAWLALWLPAMALAALLSWLFPEWMWLWMTLVWCLRPLFERAPLYVLSRQVFGEAVSWREALRAWPRQLGGGALRLTTWGRLFAAGRGVHQPIWQLEKARGKVAAERRRLIGAKGTGSAAFWFGVICAHFEGVIQIGLIAFIGVFLSEADKVNPFLYLIGSDSKPKLELLQILSLMGVTLSGAIMGPIYTACCFTLYLNRRASLEAWDIEIMLRQLKAPVSKTTRAHGGAAALLLTPLALALALAQPAPARATAMPIDTCTRPEIMAGDAPPPAPPHGAPQQAVRADVARLYGTDDLRGYSCEMRWVPKKEEKKAPKKEPALDLSTLASVLKVLLIASAILLVGWLLYYFRDKLPLLGRAPRARRATEIAGLDIRPESLPDDVAGTVRALWTGGERRAALALLYRATLSQLVNADGLLLRSGDTEGDCMRLARKARQIAPARLALAEATTTLWLNAAYADRWPDDGTLARHCDAWQSQFGTPATMVRP